MWFVAGLLLGALVLALALWLRWRGFLVRWYEWLLAGIGLALMIFALQNFWATSAEHWSFGTPLTFLMVFGLPALVLLLLAIFSAGWRYFRKGE